MDIEDQKKTELEEENLKVLDEWLSTESPETLIQLEIIDKNEFQNVAEDSTLDQYQFRWTDPRSIIRWLRFNGESVLDHIRSYHYKDLFSKITEQIKTHTANISKSLIDSWRIYKSLPLIRRLTFTGISILLIGSPPIITYFVLPRVLTDELPVITSLKPFAEEVIVLKPQERWESFLNTPRRPPPIFLLKKIIQNLKPTSNHNNPMIAIEIAVKAPNPQTLSEIKDRENEVRDKISMILGEKTFEELDSEEGKKNLNQDILHLIEKMFSDQTISDVYFHQIILKP